jgi:type IV pilus assembly protein PilC
MATYSYCAVDARGKTSKGIQDAANLGDLELRLKRSQLDLIDAKPSSDMAWRGRNKIKSTELITFFFNLEQLSRAGVPLLDSLGDLRDSLSHARFREIISHLIESIESGKTLSQAMSLHPAAFDKIFVSLTHTGEESGRLPEVFQHITNSLKWQDEMVAQTKTILIYPLFVGAVVMAITCFLLVYLVPQMAAFIQSSGQPLPLQTRILLQASYLLVQYGYVLLALPIAGVIGLRILLHSSAEMQYRADNLKLKIWLIGPVLKKIMLARFTNTFAMMYRSGLSILDCIGHSRDVVNNRVAAQALEQIMRSVEAGSNLTQSFQEAGLFPPLVIRMIRVGETTGALDQSLLNVSYFYDRDVKESVRRTQALIEPLLTLILGIVLGWVMLAVLAPIYDLVSKVRF